MNLTLSPTWPGEVANDFIVKSDGDPIGRIRLAGEMNWNSQSETWNWHININVPGATSNGSAGSLDAAKSDLKAMWTVTRAKISEDVYRRAVGFAAAAASRFETKKARRP